MIVAMFLAHLMGDFILQWDKLALWKSKELQGVIVHGGVVFLVTWLFSLPFSPLWWQGVLLISFSHFFIDAVQWRYPLPILPLFRLILDQFAHLAVILVALMMGGYVQWPTFGWDVWVAFHDERMLTTIFAFALVTMPAWIFSRFMAYGLMKGIPPRFPDPVKYLGIIERLLITLLVVIGQFVFLPVVALPRLLLGWSWLKSRDCRPVYLFEILTSVVTAVTIGLGLRLL